ncbi:MAG: ABC transporter ATP-binding protein [Proteobacteria bacterium]|nr:ABC transporter ATP-binding protein [Pseudomonadota bacterium]
MLSLEDVRVSYGGVQAVRGVSLAMREGQVVGLVGANGAGKTSVLNAITGLVPRRGRVSFRGEDLEGLKTADIVRRGMVQVAQGRQLFPEMTVLENLELGAFLLPPADVPELREKMFVRFPILKDRAAQQAGTLSGGEQQMLAMARALMGRPRALLVDEPCLGLSPKMVGVLGDFIRQVNAEGISVMVVEQNTAFVFGLAHHAYVIENGQVALDGHPDELRRDDRVRSAYLGI